MLILQRKAGESLVIGDNITVSVLSVEGGRVRLAISAPNDIPILRSELLKAKAVNQDSAVGVETPTELLGALREVLAPAAIHRKSDGKEEKTT